MQKVCIVYFLHSFCGLHASYFNFRNGIQASYFNETMFDNSQDRSYGQRPKYSGSNYRNDDGLGWFRQIALRLGKIRFVRHWFIQESDVMKFWRLSRSPSNNAGRIINRGQITITTTMKRNPQWVGKTHHGCVTGPKIELLVQKSVLMLVIIWILFCPLEEWTNAT